MADRAAYATLEAIRAAAQIRGSGSDAVLTYLIEAASREIERAMHRWFVPRTETRQYSWPQGSGNSYSLYLDADLLSVSTLTKEGENAVAIASTDYFLEPVNEGPPYWRIDIDRASNAFFDSDPNTPQRSIRVTGSWGYTNDTQAVGVTTSGLASDAAATTFETSQSDKIGIGDNLLIQSEQVYVTAKTSLDLGVNLHATTGALTADEADTNVLMTAAPTTAVRVGEVLRVDSEQLKVTAVNTTSDVEVERAYNGTTLASHAANADIFIYRTLTIERGVNGTTAATHANATAVSRYFPPRDVEMLCIAEVIAAFQQQTSGWGRSVGTGEGQREFSGRDLDRLRQSVVRRYRRNTIGVV